jgi:hypothetical protein
MLYYLLLFVVLQGLTFGARWRRGATLPSAAWGVKMAQIPLATGAKSLEIKDWLGALIDPSICSKD